MTAHEQLAWRLAAWFGLDLARGGRLFALERVIEQRARRANLASADEYVASLRGPEDAEVGFLLETVTVGHTWFFRDEEQIDAVARVLRTHAGRGVRRPSVWVAGCSTGEDAYTVALVAAVAGVDAAVLGTDVNARALARAKTARYAPWSTRKVPASYAGFFEQAGQEMVSVDDAVAAKVRFQRHNVLSPPPAAPDGVGWDVILCRNVLIYFQRAAATRTIEQMAAALAPGGWLFLGASEVLSTPPPGCTVASIGARFAIQRLVDADSPVSSGPESPVVPESSERAEDGVERALRRLEAGEKDAAIRACADILESDPLRADAHLVSGMAYHLANDPESAERALSAAVLLDARLWPAFFYLGQTLERLGRGAEAADAYRQAYVRAQAALPGALGVLEAYREEMVALARRRAFPVD